VATCIFVPYVLSADVSRVVTGLPAPDDMHTPRSDQTPP